MMTNWENNKPEVKYDFTSWLMVLNKAGDFSKEVWKMIKIILERIIKWLKVL